MSNKDLTAALKVLNTMMDATGSSMEECRTMLSLCDGDPNRATEQLLTNPFSTVTSKAKTKGKPQEVERRGDGGRGGRGSYGGSGRGGYGGGRGGGRGFATSSDQQGGRDQHDRPRGRGGRSGGYGSGTKGSNDTAGANGTAAATTTATEAPYTVAGESAEAFPPPVSSSSHAPAGAAQLPSNGWGAAAGSAGGKTFAERLKANLQAPKPEQPAKQPSSPGPQAAQPADHSSPPPLHEYTAADYVVDEYGAVDDTHAVPPDDGGARSDQVTEPPAQTYQPASSTWGADAGKIIMSSLKAAAASGPTAQAAAPAAPPAQEQTLSAADTSVAAPLNSASHQGYNYASAAPGALAPAEPKPAAQDPVEAMQLSFGSFGINTGAGGLGDGFGAGFAPHASAYSTAPEPIKPQAVSNQQAAPAVPQTSSPVPPQQQPIQQQQVQQQQQIPNMYGQSPNPLGAPTDMSMLPGAAMNPADQYKQNYGGYPLQGNLGHDKLSGNQAAPAAGHADVQRQVGQMPGLGAQYGGQVFGQQPQAASYAGFTGFPHSDVSSQPNYAAVQQAFEQYGQQQPQQQDSQKPSNPYSVPGGYGAQQSSVPPAASYNQSAQSKYPPYSGPQSGPATDLSSAPQAASASATSTSAAASGAPNMQGSGVPPQQQMYGQPAASNLAPNLAAAGYNYNLNAYQQAAAAAAYNPAASANNMYAMYAASGYGYNPYSGAYPPQGGAAPYAPSAAPQANPYSQPSQQRGAYPNYPSAGAAANPVSGSGYSAAGGSYGLPGEQWAGYDDLSQAAGQMSSVKDKDSSAGMGLGGYGQLGGPAAAGTGAAGQPQQQHQQQPGGGYGGYQGRSMYNQGGGRGGRGGGQVQGSYYGGGHRNQGYGGNMGGGYGQNQGYQAGGYNQGGYGKY